VRRAGENVTAQEGRLSVARAGRLPTLRLTSAFAQIAYPASAFPGWNDFVSDWTVSLAMQVPLFTGGRLRGDRIVAGADLDEARLRLQQTREQAALDARTSLAALDATEAAWEASAGTVEQARRAYQIAEIRYREGISTQTELGDSRLLLQQAEANRAQAARDVQVARTRLALLPDLPLGGVSVSAPAGSGAR
jgi:outer membrane protein TolC